MRYLVVIGDSRRMSEVKDNSVHLVVTSPPYWGLVRFSEVSGDLSRIESKEEFFEELKAVWKECFRVLVQGGYLACEWEDYPVGSRVHGYVREIFLAGDMVRSIEEAGFVLVSRWFWKKFKYGVGVKKFPYLDYANLLRGVEPRALSNVAYVFVFRKGNVTRKWRKEFSREEWKEWSDGVWYIDAGGEAGASEYIEGGAVFPVELARRLIRLYTERGETVLDPFLGTGTTMRAAFETGRNCIGYEINPKMLEVIKRKVGFGSATLTGEKVEWEVIVRAGR